MDVNSKNQRSLMNQWDSIIVIGENLYRKFIDENGNIGLQYIVPVHQRETLFKMAHEGKLSGHLGYEKTIKKLFAASVAQI